MGWFSNLFKASTMNKITINGKTYIVEGKDVTVSGDSIYVDGKKVVDGLRDTVKVEWVGDLANLDCTTCTINGTVVEDVDCTTCTVNGDIIGNVDATTVNCGDVEGSIDAVTVNCKTAKGGISL